MVSLSAGVRGSQRWCQQRAVSQGNRHPFCLLLALQKIFTEHYECPNPVLHAANYCANVLFSYLAAYSPASCILITVLVIGFAKRISKSKQLAVLKCMCLYYPLQSMVPYRIIEFLIVDGRNKVMRVAMR